MITLILAEVGLALLVTLVFIVLYAWRSAWQETPMGRHLMAFMAVFAGEIGSLLAFGLGLSVPIWLFAMVFGALDIVVIQRLWLLVKAQRHQL